MKKEIGSIFPLSVETLQKAESERTCFVSDRLYYSLCREALFDIAASFKCPNKKVLIPAYTCQTVITPFEEAGWHCDYYPILKELRIDVQRLLNAVGELKPSLVVVHPYFGMDLNDEEIETLNIVHDKGVAIVLDLTQCLFSKEQYNFASFVVASYRKWMPIPDGGYLIDKTNFAQIVQPEEENTEFTVKEMDAMYLRGLYFSNGEQRTKDVSIRLSKTADIYAGSQIVPHKMSQLAYNLLNCEDKEKCQSQRFANYLYLFENIKDNNRICKVCVDITTVTTAPLYFTIYVQDRHTLQRLFVLNSIYAPVIWPVEDERVLIDEDVKYIYDHLLAIPCDQRYDENDMQRIVDVVKKY